MSHIQPFIIQEGLKSSNYCSVMIQLVVSKYYNDIDFHIKKNIRPRLNSDGCIMLLIKRLVRALTMEGYDEFI